MKLSQNFKERYETTIKTSLSKFDEIDSIILFGSFVHSDEPNDIDIAIIQHSEENYLNLSLKYRKMLRDLSKQIPLDIVPIKKDRKGVFLDEINKGKIIYER